MVRVDRILAETVVNEATLYLINDPDNKGAKDLDIAIAELENGDIDRDNDKFDKAITHYCKAWKHAQKIFDNCKNNESDADSESDLDNDSDEDSDSGKNNNNDKGKK